MIQIALIIIFCILIFFIQRKMYEHFWKEGLSVQAKFLTTELPEQETGSLQLTVENAKKLPVPMLMVKFQTDRNLQFEFCEHDKGSSTTDQFYHNDVFQVGSGERVIRTLNFHGSKRGYYRINNIDLTATDLFMSKQFHSSFQPEESMYVLPRAISSRDFQFLLQQLNGEMLTKRNLYEDPFELRGIREYQPFDDMRSINWKATAKTGSFMVNQKNYTAPKTVRIFLNLEDRNILKITDALEDSIRIGAGLARYLLEQGIKVAFYCNAPDIITGAPLMRAAERGDNQMSVIMRSLARLDLTKEAMPFDRQFRKKVLMEQENTYTCFISPTFYEEFIDILQEFTRQGRNYSWYCPVQNKIPVDDLPPMLRQNIKFIRV